MIVLRRTAQGRLSELFGRSTIETDTYMRRFDIYRLALSSVDAQDAQTIAALEAYSEGVNAQFQQINRGSSGRGAPELFVFNTPFAPWRPADSLAILKLMALQSSGHLADEVYVHVCRSHSQTATALMIYFQTHPALALQACQNMPAWSQVRQNILQPTPRQTIRCRPSKRVDSVGPRMHGQQPQVALQQVARCSPTILT